MLASSASAPAKRRTTVEPMFAPANAAATATAQAHTPNTHGLVGPPIARRAVGSEWTSNDLAKERARREAAATVGAKDILPLPSSAESAGAAQVRAARAASTAAAMASAPASTPVSAAVGLPPAAAGPIASVLPSKVPVVIDEIITDTSIKRINAAGQTVCKQYKRGRYLGKGGFARCYEMQSMDSLKVYAGKIIPKASIVKPSAKKKLIAEISIHRKIHHTNVVKFERFFEDTQNVYILLEICTNQTLMELVRRRKRLTETETQYYMFQLANTMIYLHAHNIIHRDLKLGNLFLNENLDIRIGDFGLAAQLEHPEERKRTICGTPNYIAPEILDSKNGHSFEVDTWAMGVIMYTMLIGQPPFETSSVKTTYERIRCNTYEFPPTVAISPAARSLIERILSSSPDARPTLTEMVQDPFFTQSPFPKQLPISCINKPLEWKHNWHHHHQQLAQQLPQQQQQQAENGQQQENVGLAVGAVPLATRAALTSRALNVAPIPALPATDKKSVVSLSARPTTAPGSSAARHVEAKIASPPSALHASAKRLTSATPVDIHATVLTTPVFPAPSPTYAAEPVHPKAFFKDLLTTNSANAAGATEKANNAAPMVAAHIAVPVKRLSGGASTDRRSSGRRSGGGGASEEKSNGDDDQLAAGMKAMDLHPATSAPTPSGVQEEDGGSGGVDAEEDVEDVRKMHDEIERSFCTPPSAADATGATTPAAAAAATRKSFGGVAPAAAVSPLVPASLWVNKWVDYSNKYGLGYLLSNGSSGVYFNDSSKAILDKDAHRWEYMERKVGAATSSDVDRQCYTMTDYPPALQKKVTLLKHFMNYLVPPAEAAAAMAAAPTSTSPASTAAGAGAPPVYVKKWLRTKHAIFFRLSNRTVQVIFLDHTELVLSSQHNTVTYTDKNKKREVFSLERDSASDATQEKPDLAKRMKYTKDILHHLLTHTTTAAAAATKSGATTSATAAEQTSEK